tara:strand:+ start:569 stop:832 length:264 start_codon:yes stop_codon:yes gene_type:complete
VKDVQRPADLMVCEACREYFPASHPLSGSWAAAHSLCTLPEYQDWGGRMGLFAERRLVERIWTNEIPDGFACHLGELELLAYVGAGP